METALPRKAAALEPVVRPILADLAQQLVRFKRNRTPVFPHTLNVVVAAAERVVQCMREAKPEVAAAAGLDAQWEAMGVVPPSHASVVANMRGQSDAARIVPCKEFSKVVFLKKRRVLVGIHRWAGADVNIDPVGAVHLPHTVTTLLNPMMWVSMEEDGVSLTQRFCDEAVPLVFSLATAMLFHDVDGNSLRDTVGLYTATLTDKSINHLSGERLEALARELEWNDVNRNVKPGAWMEWFRRRPMHADRFTAGISLRLSPYEARQGVTLAISTFQKNSPSEWWGL